MTGWKTNVPEKLAPLSRATVATLARFTAFPWPMMLAACRDTSADPTAIDPDQLRAIIPQLARRVALTGTADQGTTLELELIDLADRRDLHD